MNKTKRALNLKDQEWRMVVTQGGTISRSGTAFADRLVELEIYDDSESAAKALADSKIGDVIKTGVSAYERTK
jgi:hypothetical protein